VGDPEPRLELRLKYHGFSTVAQNIADSHELVIDSGLSFELGEEMSLQLISDSLGDQFDIHYGLLAPEQTILVRAYTDDSHDQVLAEMKPKFIVMFEPNMEFIRRIEVGELQTVVYGKINAVLKVYRSSNPGLGVRVYHMIYHNCCEEHKYLAAIRREKESFERMIKERGVSPISLPHLWMMLMPVTKSMLLPILDEESTTSRVGESVIKTINSRIAGGRRELNTEPSRVGSELLFTMNLHISSSGHRGFEGVSLDLTVPSPCLKTTGHSCHAHRW
jgi:DNA excision repair protein ERCC-4